MVYLIAFSPVDRLQPSLMPPLNESGKFETWCLGFLNYLGHGSFMWDDIFPNGNNPKSMHVFCCLCVPGHYAGYFLPQSACPRRDPLAEPTYLGHRLFSGTNAPCGVQLHLAHTCGLRG